MKSRISNNFFIQDFLINLLSWICLLLKKFNKKYFSVKEKFDLVLRFFFILGGKYFLEIMRN
jgi:hypothetical protein